MSSHLRRNAILQVIFATVLWGCGYPIWKALTKAAPPLLLLSLSFLLASLLMLILYRLQPKTLLAQLRKQPLLIPTCGLFGGVFGTTLIFYALTLLDTGVAAILEKLQPIFTLLASWIFLKELIPAQKLPFMLAAIILSAGIAIPDPLALNLEELPVLGILAAIGSSFFFGVNTVVCKILLNKGLSPRELSFFRMFFGGILAIPLVFLDGSPIRDLQQFDLNDWGLFLAGTLVSFVVAFHYFFLGLQHIKASTSTFLELITPVVALFLGIAFFEEWVSITQMLSIPVFFLCIWKISVEEGREAHISEIHEL